MGLPELPGRGIRSDRGTALGGRELGSKGSPHGQGRPCHVLQRTRVAKVGEDFHLREAVGFDADERVVDYQGHTLPVYAV